MSVRLDWQKHFAQGKVVNLGCGDIPIYLGENVTHVDFDNFSHKNFVQADIHNLPFKDNEFDTAILGDVLEHSPDPVQMVRESARVAKVLVATVFEHTEEVFPGTDGPERRGYKTTAEWYKTIPGYDACTEIIPDDVMPHHYHIQRFTDKSLLDIFWEAGVSIDLYQKAQEGIENGKPYYNWLIVGHKRGGNV